ncbi:hypothetical protein GCM10027422_43470 [Hymenobacter arcticus]
MATPLPSLNANLDAHLPVLLLPVSVQVKFVHTPARPAAGTAEKFELLVRCYPDQLGISTHQVALTAPEQAAGRDYWGQSPFTDDHGQPQPHDLGHWRALVARFGVPRASWILRQTSALGQATALPVVDSNWTEPAVALGLPDRFSVLLYTAADAAQADEVTEVKATAAGQLLFGSPTSPAYAASRVPQPTTEFLVLRHAATGNAIGPQALSVSLHPDPTPSTPSGVLGVDDQNKWTVDFAEAERVGMAVRIAFASEEEYRAGFARLVVVGVRQASPTDSQQAFERLLSDHYYTDGLQLVAQGTPTNNTDTVAAGYSSRERADADAAFGLLTQSATFDAATPWAARPDGQHLAAALGLSSALAPAGGAPAALPTVPALAGAEGQDTTEAQLINQALWPATYGYFLEEMLAPLLPPAALDWTRQLVESYVLARGTAPALRVGAQPYGLLATTQFSAWQADDQQPGHAYATTLQAVLRRLDAAWTERLNPQDDLYPASVAAGAAQAGFVKPPTVRDNLLTTLALDATSTEYYQRYLIGPLLAEALNNYAHQTPDDDNQLSSIWADAASGIGVYDPAQSPVYKDFADLLDPAGTLLPRPLAAPPIFGQVFQSAFTKLADAFADEPAARRQEGVLLDDQPLSETAPLASFGGLLGSVPGFTPAAGRAANYVDWLAWASFDEVRLERFTSIIDPANSGNFHAPKSLLYNLLRQAVLLRYWAAAKAYFTTHTTAAGQRPSAAQQLESETFNILTLGDKPRWNWLYDQVTTAGGGGTQPLHEYLRAHDADLAGYLTSLGRLAALPTARLERLLAEHLDLGSYRLDAWRLAPVTERLHLLRETSAGAQGSHLGAFGWLEDGRPTDHSTVGADGVHADPDNLGYLHAPSLTHGTAAAILRQGYKSRQHTADPLDPASDRMAVDISSRRVRAALELLEGLRGGHSLGALLGQRFERALTQQPGTADGQPYAYYISQFRRSFPLADELALPADQAASSTPPPVGTAVEQAQRQVTDGAALLRTAAQRKAYPYGVALTPAATSDFGLFITAQLAQLTDELDALGDLAVTESIYQAARGNADRAGAVLESVAQGQFPVHPDIVHPNARGFTLTQRVLVQLPAAALTGWPAGPTPRALAAPRLNAWLGQFLPDPQAVSFALGYRTANGDWLPRDSATLFQAGLQPIDLLYLLDKKALQADSTLDRLLSYTYGLLPRVLPSGGPVPADARLALDYTTGPAPAALARVLPLLARLRQLLSGARPALAPDLQAPGRVADANEDAGAQLAALSSRLLPRQTTLAGLAATAATAADCYQAALFDVAEALPGLAPGADAATLDAASRRVRQALQTRLADLPATAAPTVAAELDRAQALFGPAFRPDVEFALGNPAASATDPANLAQAAYAAAVDPAAALRLLRYYDKPAQALTPSLAMQEWVHGLATVREPLNHLDKILLINSLLDPATELAPLPLLPAQLVSVPGIAPDTKGDYWLGLPWDTATTDDKGNPKPPYAPPADALSLVQWLPAQYQATDMQCALWLDEWAETLPQPQQPTALTFHFDQPNSEAPQTMLLVVPPTPPAQLAPGATWTLATLAGALNETLDLAKKRTVEPDALAFTPLATVLPAVVAPVAQQAVTLTLDLGRLNNSARFDEVALQPE